MPHLCLYFTAPTHGMPPATSKYHFPKQRTFTQASQLCAVLLSECPEDVLVPEIRRRSYPNLGLGTIVLALDRYKEQAWSVGREGGKEPTGFPAKKAISQIAKSLRGQMVQGPSTKVLEDF